MKKSMLFLLLALASGAGANDGVYYTSGSLLVPVRETDVAVGREVLEIKLCRDGFAEVTVDYTLYNNSEEKTVTMAFEAAAPYNADEPFSRDCVHPCIKDFTVLFNGRRLAYSNAAVASQYGVATDFTPLDLTVWKASDEVPDDVYMADDMLCNTAQPDSFCSFSYAYYFEAPFRKGENRVRHTYRYRMSHGVGREFEVPYALAPATRWANGRIDDFTLRITADGPRDIIMPDTLFRDAPFMHSRAGARVHHLQHESYGELLFAEMVEGDMLEWHGKDFAPHDGMCIESTSNLLEGVGEFATAGRVVVDDNGREARYLADSGDNYFVEAQDYGFVPKSKSRIEFREAGKGQGYIYLKSGIRKANVRQSPSRQSPVLLTIDGPESELPEGIPCLGLAMDTSEYNTWYKVSVGGKTGYVSSRIALWDSIAL